MTYTATEVQEALENLTWVKAHNVYKRGGPGESYWARDPQTGQLIVEGTEDVTYEFSWSEAEDSVGHVYDVLGGVEVVQSDPGGEGHGENIHIVVRVNETGELFRIDEFYSSYGDGSVYDDRLRVVNAYERTVIVYE
jgi:hypothetical protein